MKKVQKIVFPLIALSIVAAIVWRAPVNGWWSIVWLVGVIAMSVIRRPHEKANMKNEIVDSNQNIVDNVLQVAVFVGLALLPVLQLSLGILGFADYTLPVWICIFGVALLVVGLWFFWRSHNDLGRNWSTSLQIREGHDLITYGVYKRIRHPMYSAFFLISIAQALLIQNWIAGLSGIVAFGLMYLIRVPQEETMMYERFGEKYRDYCQKTGRVFPKLLV